MLWLLAVGTRFEPSHDSLGIRKLDPPLTDGHQSGGAVVEFCAPIYAKAHSPRLPVTLPRVKALIQHLRTISRADLGLVKRQRPIAYSLSLQSRGEISASLDSALGQEISLYPLGILHTQPVRHHTVEVEPEQYYQSSAPKILQYP